MPFGKMQDAARVEQGDQVEDELDMIKHSKRRWVLLLIFSVAIYLDTAGRASVLALVDVVSRDLHVGYGTSTWVLTAYNVTFASFLPFFGRLSDLFSPKHVFVIGFVGLGIFNLIDSFMPEQYSFFVFRALSGVCGAATIPSAMRLISNVFDKSELHTAFSIFTACGLIANATGLIIGGIFNLVRLHDQMAGWRWTLRFITIVALPFALLAAALVPYVKGPRQGESARTKWKQFDIPGAFMLLSATILIILGLTLGASYGWTTAKFLVPFILAWPLLATFFYWEARLPKGYALIPPFFWSLPNMGLLMFTSMELQAWWSITQLPLVERFQEVFGENALLATVRMLPQGVSALIPAFVLAKLLPRANLRLVIPFAFLVAAAGTILIIFSKGRLGTAYWRWDFPGFVIGSMATCTIYIANTVVVMKSVPADMTGMAGALLQVSNQLGTVIALAVQAGLLTLEPGNVRTWGNIEGAFWFQTGWTVLDAVLVAVFLRQPKEGEVRAFEKEGEKVGVRGGVEPKGQGGEGPRTASGSRVVAESGEGMGQGAEGVAELSDEEEEEEVDAMGVVHGGPGLAHARVRSCAR